jgi:hypothetical protein
VKALSSRVRSQDNRIIEAGSGYPSTLRGASATIVFVALFVALDVTTRASCRFSRAEVAHGA